MRLLRRRPPPPDPPVSRMPCADCGQPEHPGVLNRLNGRQVCTPCYRFDLGGAVR